MGTGENPALPTHAACRVAASRKWYNEGMSVQEIENAIQKLNRDELAQLADWLAEYQNDLWDEQIERDAKAGKLDKLIARADAAYDAGTCTPI